MMTPAQLHDFWTRFRRGVVRADVVAAIDATLAVLAKPAQEPKLEPKPASLLSAPDCPACASRRLAKTKAQRAWRAKAKRREAA